MSDLQFQLKDEQQKIEELIEKHVDATGRIEQALKISQQDQDVIQELRKEVENAWNVADTAKLREQHTHESLNVTRERYQNLLQQMKKYETKIEDSDELGKHKATVLQECERLNSEVDEMNKRLLVQRAYSDELQKKLDESLEKNRELFREWDTATNESLSNRKKIETLQKRLEELTEEHEKITESMIHYKEAAEARHKRLKEREKQVIDLTDNLEKFKSDNAVLNIIKGKMELSLKAYKSDIVNFKHDMDQFQNYIRLKDDENKKLLLEHEREMKKVENLVRKISSVERVASKQEQEILTKKTEILTAEKERDLIKKASDDMKKDNDKLQRKIENQMREAEKLNGKLMLVQNLTNCMLIYFTSSINL